MNLGLPFELSVGWVPPSRRRTGPSRPCRRDIDELCLTFPPNDTGAGGRGGTVGVSPPYPVIPAARGQDGWALLIW